MIWHRTLWLAWGVVISGYLALQAWAVMNSRGLIDFV